MIVWNSLISGDDSLLVSVIPRVRGSVNRAVSKFGDVLPKLIGWINRALSA